MRSASVLLNQKLHRQSKVKIFLFPSAFNFQVPRTLLAASQETIIEAERVIRHFNITTLLRHAFSSNNLIAKRKLNHYVMRYEVVLGRKSAELTCRFFTLLTLTLEWRSAKENPREKTNGKHIRLDVSDSGQ